MFRGADIHPKPCDVLPVEIGGLQKKITIFFIVDDFFNKKNPDSFLQLGRVGLSEPWSLVAKTSTEGINSMMPKRGHSKFLEFFQNPIFFQPRKSFSIPDLSFPKFIPSTTGGFSEKNAIFNEEYVVGPLSSHPVLQRCLRLRSIAVRCL